MKIDPATGAPIPETPEEAAQLGMGAPMSPVAPPMASPAVPGTPPVNTATQTLSSGMLNKSEDGMPSHDANAKEALAQDYQDATGKPMPVAGPPAGAPAAPPGAPKDYVDQYPQGGQKPPQGGGGPGFGKMLASKSPETYGQTPGMQEYNAKAYDFLSREAEYGKQLQMAQAEEAAKNAATYADGLARVNAMQEEAARREAERQLWARTALAKHEKMAAELATQQIDPTRFFTSGGTGGQIISALGVGLAGLGDAMLMAAGHPGGGGFMRSIHGMVEADIATQVANFKLKRDALAASEGVFAERMAIYKDERVAEASAKATVYEWMAGQARVAAATQWMKTSQIKVTQVADELQFKADEFRDKIRIASEQAYDQAIMRQMQAYWAEAARKRRIVEEQAKMEVEATLKAATNPEGAGALTGSLGFTHFPEGHPLKGQLAILRKDEQGRIYYSPVGGGGQGVGPGGVDPFSKRGQAMAALEVKVRTPDGKVVPVIASTEDSAKKLKEALRAGADYRGALQDMLRIASDPNFSLKSPSELYTLKQQYDAAFSKAQVSYKQLYALGAYDNGVKELTSNVFPTFSKALVAGGSTAAMLHQEMENSNNIVNNAMDAYAANPDSAPKFTGPGQWGFAGTAAALGGKPVEAEKEESGGYGGLIGAAVGAGLGPAGMLAGYMIGK